MTIGRIVVDLLARTGSFETDLNRAGKLADKRAREIDASMKRAGTAIGVALVAGATAAVVALKSTINQMDELSKSAQKVGLPTEELSKLAYAASLADVPLDALVTSLGRLTKAQAAALKETSQQAKVFDALGISVKDAEGKLRSSGDVLADFADRFKELGGSPEAMAAGFAIFGRSFQDLIPLLKDGSAGLREAGAELETFGGVLSTEAGQQAEAFNDNLTRLQVAAQGLALAVATELLPDLVELTENLVQLSKDGEAVHEIVDAIRFVVDDISLSFDQLNHLLETGSNLFGGMAEQAAGALQVLGGFSQFDWEKVQKGIARFTGGSAKAGMGFESFEDFQARNARKTTNPQAGPDLGWLGVPDFLSPQQPFSAVGFSATAPVGKGADAGRLRGVLGGEGGATKKAAAKATDELTEAEKAYREVMETNLLIDEQVDEFRRERIDTEYQLAKAVEEGRANAAQQIADMQAELDLYGLSNMARAEAIALHYADANATEDQIAKIRELAVAMETAAQQTDFIDAFRADASNALTDFVTGAKSAKDALTDLFDSLAERVTQMIAERWIEQLFGSFGTTGQGSAGGDWIGAVFSMFGGARATGGPVDPSKGYMVGERGPEWFQPNTAGRILPANQTAAMAGAGGGSYAPSITQQFYSQEQITARNARQMQQEAAVKQRTALARNK